jgi:hypothetical protein
VPKREAFSAQLRKFEMSLKNRAIISVLIFFIFLLRLQSFLSTFIFPQSPLERCYGSLFHEPLVVVTDLQLQAIIRVFPLSLVTGRQTGDIFLLF